MLTEILIAILLGVVFGTFTGITPGIHTNLLAAMLLGISAHFAGIDTLTLSVFIISMALTHTFADAIPSIFLGAPDEDTAMGVLPGHRMLLKGEGVNAVKLTLIGSLFCLITGTIIVFPLAKAIPKFYDFINPAIPWLLLATIIFLMLKDLIQKILYLLASLDFL